MHTREGPQGGGAEPDLPWRQQARRAPHGLISSRATVSMNFHRKGKHLYFGKERRRYVTPWSLGQI